MRPIISQFGMRFEYPVLFTRSVFEPNNLLLKGIMEKTGGCSRVLVVIDSNLLAAQPDLIKNLERYATSYPQVFSLACQPHVMAGGEDCKNGFAQVNKLHELIHIHHLCRHSFIFVIGGGAVLDAAGFAAATAHRGIRLVRFPSTILAQNDAGIGVKNAINRFGRKNFCGTFAPPFAVINDYELLTTLSERDKRAGISEAIKVALIKDIVFFVNCTPTGENWRRLNRMRWRI